MFNMILQAENSANDDFAYHSAVVPAAQREEFLAELEKRGADAQLLGEEPVRSSGTVVAYFVQWAEVAP